MSSLKEVSEGLSWGSAWRIAGKIAFEVQFNSAMDMSQGAMGQSVEKQIDKARNNARINKFMISFFTALIALVFGFIVFGANNNFFGVAPENTWLIIAVATSLFILMTFGFLLFWGIMVSTSFISSGSASIGLYLPLLKAHRLSAIQIHE